MLNLDLNNAVKYTQEQELAIDRLISNRGGRTGADLWAEKGPDDIYVHAKERIKAHCLEIQKVRCAFCETILEYGGVQIEHFAHKGKYQQFLYEPLNLVCSCPVCNGFAKKGARNTIKGDVKANYVENEFKYVHPYLDNPSNEIKYRDIFGLRVDREQSTEKGKATIDMFHWDNFHSAVKRLSNLIVRPTSPQRRKMIAEILNHK
jgi:uncharacterized protein (TIGR02646 family)